ncbi:SDR family oxidoreductase [Saccharopolyspora indica]|uniref:SDR family NAD(P)-dependent oxidoreductase n=1 Tax=Saccharopolyspora indica TaxID=1229659 RepID=UPI0022EA9D40|nr:SDR family NAD(P)-dependent oxidoreductase [Saccharopolyspora indica]MDA3642609.1 SDR family oxidoreductase [Saccharopolyspora indica]
MGNPPYGASKRAMDRITLAVARELAQLGVSRNAINPGPTDTGCANLVVFLCSAEGGWINGQLLHSDGGLG